MRRDLRLPPPSRGLPAVFRPASWGLTHWLLLVAGLLLLASYVRLVSWGQVEAAIHDLAEQPSVQEAYQDPATGRAAALFVVFSFLLLTPFSVLGALFVLVFAVWIFSAILGSIGRHVGIPEWAVKSVVVVGLAGMAYAKSPLWLPWGLRALGLVARAYLVLID